MRIAPLGRGRSVKAFRLIGAVGDEAEAAGPQAVRIAKAARPLAVNPVCTGSISIVAVRSMTDFSFPRRLPLRQTSRGLRRGGVRRARTFCPAWPLRHGR